MKRSFFVGLLFVEALVCIVFVVLQAPFADIFTVAIAFPFEQIGIGLRLLSLSGDFGNVVAIFIYCLICLLPIAMILLLRKKHKLFAEDGLLVLLSAALFAVLYLMINPGIISSWMGSVAGLTVGKAALGVTVYSVIFGYIALRALRLFAVSGTTKLAGYISIMLRLLNVIFIFMVFGSYFGSMLNSIAALRAGNVENEHLLGTSYVFLVLQFLVNALPYMFNIVIIFATLRWFDEMRADRYSAETNAAAARASRLCATALIVITLVSIGFNLLQLLFAGSLMIINTSIQIPVFSIAFVLAVLLLTRLLADNKELKDDIDMFV